MKTILLETNAICKCLDYFHSGNELSYILNRKNFTPIVNIHTTYELARTFLDPNKHEKGKELFLILKELKPIFSCLTGELLKQEVSKLRSGTNVDFICNPIFNNQIWEAIENLSNGNFATHYENFIREREANIKTDQKIWDKLIISKDRFNYKSTTFDDLTKNYISSKNIEQLRPQINEHIDENLTVQELMKFLTETTSYPALNTLLRTNLYLNYKALKDGNRPAKGNTDDFRHLIDASYCSSLVTNDAKLTSIASEICPELEIITFENLIA